MIKINLVCVGKVKEKYFLDGVNEYSKRLSRFCEFKIKEVREENFSKDDASLRKLSVKKESDSVLKEFKGYNIVTSIDGKKLSSEDLAKTIKELNDKGIAELTFVIGGSNGLTDEVKKAADFKISFSDMTFPHTLFRLMLVEQIYRAFMINAGAEYHK